MLFYNFIFAEVEPRINELCFHKNGLCVMKNLVAHANALQQTRILKQMDSQMIETISDPYGNYAVTDMISSWPIQVCEKIFQSILTRLNELCTQKYSSNVVERCLELAPEPVKCAYINELSDSQELANLIKNQYGNYVIQKALVVSSGDPKRQLLAAIEKNSHLISDKKIRQKWQRIVQQQSTQINQLKQTF